MSNRTKKRWSWTLGITGVVATATLVSPSAAAMCTKISAAEVKAAVAPHLPAARDCGPRLDATPGEKVTIKLRIDGATGKVDSASATANHATTRLGQCVAKELAKANFPTFDKKSLGVLYPVRMPPGLYGPYAPAGTSAP